VLRHRPGGTHGHPAVRTASRSSCRDMRSRARKLSIAFLVVVALLGATAWYVQTWPQFGGVLAGARLARARANPHHHDGTFVNPLPPAGYTFDDAWNLFKGQFFGHEVRVPPRPIPVIAVDVAALKTAPAATGLRAFWIGHASVFIEIDGTRLLV